MVDSTGLESTTSGLWERPGTFIPRTLPHHCVLPGAFLDGFMFVLVAFCCLSSIQRGGPAEAVEKLEGQITFHYIFVCQTKVLCTIICPPDVAPLISLHQGGYLDYDSFLNLFRFTNRIFSSGEELRKANSIGFFDCDCAELFLLLMLGDCTVFQKLIPFFVITVNSKVETKTIRLLA